MQIGFLFLRYVADPKTLLAWVGPFLADKEVSLLASTPRCDAWQRILPRQVS